ncbi:hypothetical protein HD806DRAFT_522035 [Xylariaceae sp. AK1471]|nr:hypothetical protein HD806DRAFT_522035 [Xylariaceae sp. AK1471]
MVSGSLIDPYEGIRNSPAGRPPTGVVPDYENPPHRNGLAIAVITASIGVTTIAGLMRFYSKVFCTRSPFFIGGTWVLTTIPQEAGFFVHVWNLLVRDIEGFIYSYFLSTILYCVALLLAKAAMLLDWAHIFVARRMRKRFYWICCGMILANTALYIATIITVCYASFNLLMLALPHTVIWKLVLTTKQKFGVSVVFSVGALACTWAAARVVSAVNLSRSQDTSYAYSQYIMWGLAEVTTAELVFCVPSFPALFRRQSPLYRLYYRLRAKITMILLPEHLASSNVTPYTRGTWLDDGSDTSLTELEPIKIEAGCGY